MLKKLTILKKLTYYTCIVKYSSKKICIHDRCIFYKLVNYDVCYTISADSPASSNLLHLGFKSSYFPVFTVHFPL